MSRRGLFLSAAFLLLGAACGTQREPTTAPSELATMEPDLAGSKSCGVIAEEPSRGADHLEEGAPLPPGSPRPASSGPHAPVPLPPVPPVHFEPIDEAAAVHNLEHGYVLLYHVPDLLDSGVLERLAALAESKEKVIMAPYDLGPDTALAFVAWTRVQTCGPAVAPEEAEGQARGFIQAFGGEAGVAPEPLGA